MKRRNLRPGLMTIAQAAEYGHVTYNAVMQAIYNKKLKARRIGYHWYVTKEDFDDYRASRYDRSKRVENGNILFDPAEGRYSTAQAVIALSTALGRPFNLSCLYQRIYRGQVKASRHGTAWMITQDEIIKILRKEERMEVGGQQRWRSST